MSMVIINPRPTHSLALGYFAWIFGVFGAHRFYFGKPWTGLLWLCTGGVFLIGWFIDLFLIESMYRETQRRYVSGSTDYSVAWLLSLAPLGLLGLHRIYMGKILTGLLWMFTGGLLGLGLIYDLFTLNEQVDELNRAEAAQYAAVVHPVPLNDPNWVPAKG